MKELSFLNLKGDRCAQVKQEVVGAKQEAA